MKTIRQSITAVPGIRLGHAQDEVALTGCSVVLFPPSTICGIDQRGGAPGTRETDLLHPMHLIHEIHAILLSGGSAFGLDAAGGVMRFLEENGIGIQTSAAKVPIVPAAVIYDLDVGSSHIRPDAVMGYEACQNSTKDDFTMDPDQGNIGAGTGARVGSIFGNMSAMKSGIGSAAVEIRKGLIVAAIFVVNAFGDVVDHKTGRILAGARIPGLVANEDQPDSLFTDTLQTMRTFKGLGNQIFTRKQNTVIGVVATNAAFNKEEINKVAQMAHDGIARTIRPAHTMLDGDTIFAAATQKKKADINLIGAFAAEVTVMAIENAVKFARPAGGLPAISSIMDRKEIDGAS
jgi:L-aminopeptidase/D-esterase-like protein